MATVMKEETTEENQPVEDNSKVKLIDMKVKDLKVELEKRELDNSGVKSALIERMKEALLGEGENPDDYTFDVPSENKTTLSNNIPEKDTNGEVNEDEDADLEELADITDVVDESNADEKVSSNDPTLQITIDEEEAQLNEDESILEDTKVVEDDNKQKVVESDNKPKVVKTIKKKTDNSTNSLVLLKNASMTIAKSSDESKEKKAIKSLPSKGSESSSTSQKTAKVVAKVDKSKNEDALKKSIWITGLPSDIVAADLKVLCSNQGKVVSIRIIKNTKRVPTRCYGFVTMGSSKEALNAIQNLHHVEVNGRVISVEGGNNKPSFLKRTDSKHHPPIKSPLPKKENKTAATSKSNSELKSPSQKEKVMEDKPETKKSEGDKERERKLKERRDKYSDRHSEDHHRPMTFSRPRFGTFSRRPIRGRPIFGASNFRPRSSFYPSRDDRLIRDNYREREDERRRDLEHRLIERKQRDEALRLEREKEKLRMERELLERERAEILKLEHEKQKLERERLERERDELRRVVELRRSLKRPFTQDSDIWDDLKRQATAHIVTRNTIQESAPSNSRYNYGQQERQDFSRQDFDRPHKKYFPIRSVEPASRSTFGERDTRRNVTVRPREERQVVERGVFKDRDARRSYATKERHLSSKRDPPKEVWKQERRIERVVSSNNSGSQRRMTYY